MTAVWLVSAGILVVVLATYALQAVLLSLRLLVWLLVRVALPLLVLLGWLIVLPFRPARRWPGCGRRGSDPNPSRGVGADCFICGTLRRDCAGSRSRCCATI